MSALSQERRLIQIDTPLGDNVFIVEEILGTESISSLFSFTAQLFSERVDIKPEDILGHSVTVTLQSDNTDKKRYINAVVNYFRAEGVGENGLAGYQFCLVPSLWLATLASKNRIFQKQTVKDIIQKVLSDYSKQVKFDFKATGSFPSREYCVQYQETDFEFVSRLLAEEGISYYFKHTKNQHQLVFVNSPQDFNKIDTKPLEFVGDSSTYQKDILTKWQRSYSYLTSGYVLTDYNEFSPTIDNKQKHSSSLGLFNSHELIIHDHGAFNHESDDVNKHKYTESNIKAYTQRMLESIESDYDIAQSASNSNLLSAGGRFTLQHSLSSEAGEYLVTHGTLHAKDGNDKSTLLMYCFECVPAKTILRPKMNLFKKTINTPQVAEVVETLATEANSQDNYTQVKVKFPWSTEQNSCWIRVVQQFAGNDWGSNFVPRAGQEVIINYIDGNPDRPLVMGAVYNSKNNSPNYTATQSGWKTEFNGSQFNELRFDDKKDAEEIYMEAGKDHNWLVRNNQTGTVKNNQILTVEKNRTTVISEGTDQLTIKKGNQTVEISAGNHSLKVSQGTANIDVMKAITITSQTSIELKVGANSIKIDQSGIEIKGTMIKSKASALSELSAGGMMTVKGAITKIN